MAFSLYCLVVDEKSEIDLKLLEKQLRFCFSKTQDFQLIYEDHPFNSHVKNLLLTLGEWWIRVHYEAGELVKDDSIEIAKYAKPDLIESISSIDRRVRVRFASDEDKSHTTQIMLMIEFLESKKDFVIFDPQRKKLLVEGF